MHINDNSLKHFKSLFHVNVSARPGDGADDLTLSSVFLVSPLREAAFIQVEEDRVERLHLSIENAFHVTVSSERFFNVADSSAFRSQLARLEVVDVIVVIEHESNGGSATMDLKRMTAENHALQNNSIWCARQKISIGDLRH